MGPEATIQFYKELILICQKEYGSKYDNEFPNIIIYNLPVPDVVEGIRQPKKVLQVLKRGIKTLEIAGVDFIVVPCNTINYFYKDMVKMTKLPIYNIIEETTKAVNSKKFRNVGVIATKTTIKTKLYKKIFNKYKIKLLLPDKNSRELTNKIILNILEGKRLKKDKEALLKIVQEFKTKGAEAIVLGCTELPLLIKQKEIDIPIFDTIKVLADSTIKYSIQSGGLQKVI